ncbi:fatty acid desaturase [Methylopila capsulata]|uniref:Fatty acid desaturase n=1 Tax=Methylopila capsulata TaxID=61654 RepID=A0A9W6MSS7_9HYPH|nr:fatty acid desaturase [Methylopila capsulata]MBM7852861.1 fatty acid desaturase [Methylopila capsulata]GLK57070.1 DesA-family fatty acid desaturase [Methylopila capsulata]
MSASGTAAPEPNLVAQAHKLCADLTPARPWIYWTDLVLTAFTGYAAFAGAALAPGLGLRSLFFVVAALAFYRGVSFIHEVSHLRPQDVPGFRNGYDALIGVPFLTPSLMYEGVHNQHHAKSRYGTKLDPEYLPLASGPVVQVLLFLLVSALAPVGLFLRFALLAPLSALHPKIRAFVIERCSALAINPEFRRDIPTGDQARRFRLLETLCSVWAIAVLALTAAGVISLTVFLTALALGAAVGVVNQFRTLVAHHWENDHGAEMTATEQFLDSVNVPPPATLPMLWAPVGLRYHGLHHLLPRLPYHALGAAHARLCATLPPESPYHKGSHRGFWHVTGRLLGEIRGRKSGVAEAVPGE